jgi:hypothetical protein
VLVVVLLGAALPVAADSVQLLNGDVLSGRVLTLDDKQLRLQSDTLGQINIPRDKIASISLGETKAAPAPKAGAAATPEAVFKQLQTSGVSPKEMAELQKMFPLLANPEAAGYFNDMVKGILGGTGTLGDLRKEAMRARDELKKATKGLGPQVEAGMAPYLKILESFIRETDPAATTKPKTVAPEEKK